MGPDGVMRLCADAGVDPEDPAMLVLAWRCGCAAMGVFTEAEFTHGMAHLACTSAAQLPGRVARLRASLADRADLRAVFRFAFEFMRSTNESQAQRGIAAALAADMLRCILGGGRWADAEPFLEFLQVPHFILLLFIYIKKFNTNIARRSRASKC